MTQTQEILKYLQDHGSITPLEALREIGCFRLAARIYDLEQKGYNIPRETITVHGKKTGKAVKITKYLKPPYTGDK